MMKGLSFAIIFSFVSFFASVSQSYATVLYTSPLNGNDNFKMDWNLLGGSPAFSTMGLSGTFDYWKDLSSYDQVVKLHFNPTNQTERVIIGCRAQQNYFYIEQTNFTLDGIPGNITEGINGNYFGLLPTYVVSNTFHDLELDCINNVITFLIDGNIMTSVIASPNYSTASTGIRLYSNGNASYSNLVICNSATLCLFSPNPSPTPTPTLTPTPTSIQLNVPLVKQTSSPWGTQEYDSAHIWSPLFKTIGDWGCALTSAVMNLQYYGITKMPDGSSFDPGTLNNWLKSQRDGYIHEGWVNWLAISRLTRLARLAFNNPGFIYDALVYNRPSNQTASQVIDDISHNIPDIIETPGHFVVGKGIQGNTIYINDPYFSNTTLGSNIVALGKFVPSHTDLSYLEFVGDPSFSMTILDSNNQSVGNSYIQQPLTNDTNPTQQNGSPLQFAYLPKPGNGQYTLTVTSPKPNQPFSIGKFVYDINGNPTISTILGMTNSTNTYSTPITVKKITIDSFIIDLQNALQFHTLTKDQYQPLFAQAKNIKKELEKNQLLVAKIHLNIILALLKTMPGIPDGAKTLLENDITNLLGNL